MATDFINLSPVTPTHRFNLAYMCTLKIIPVTLVAQK